MGETQQELKTDNASRKTGRTTKNRRSEQASRAREQTDEKAACKDGAELLRQAADKRVGRNSEKLADLLTEKALKGDLASTKTLVSLAAGKKPIPEPVKKRRGPSYAERLAAEPEWEGEASHPSEQKSLAGDPGRD